MVKLEHTEIYRGGVTADSFKFEPRNCTFTTNMVDRALDLTFRLASRGGGTTKVLLQIGLDDFTLILEAIASTITEARRVQSNEKAQTSSLVKKLEDIEEYVEKFINRAGLPVSEDELPSRRYWKRSKALSAFCRECFG